MPEFTYKAVDRNGIVIKERIQEKSKHSLVKRLKDADLTPIDIVQTSFTSTNHKRRERKRKSNDELVRIASAVANQKEDNLRGFTLSEKIKMKLTTRSKITTRDLEIFTQNFYLLKKAGFNNIHALSTIIKSTENPDFRGILEDVLSGVEGGDYMYTTLEYYTDVFPYIYINLIKVGELSGSLDESLAQAMTYLETSSTLTKKIKGILIPNITQFVVLLIILFAGSMYIIPIIQNLFIQVGSTDRLPSYTIAVSNFLNSFVKVWYIPIIIIGIIAAYIFVKVQTPKGRYKWDRFIYTMPLFGKLNYDIALSRIFQAMVLNLKNGLRIQEALEVSKSVTKNYVMLSILESAINNTIAGDSWVQPFEESGLTSSMITEMLKIGMQTDLTQMVEKIVEYLEIDINNKLDRIVKVLPDILYAIVGVLIILVTIVVLVPCIQAYMGEYLFSAAGM